MSEGSHLPAGPEVPLPGERVAAEVGAIVAAEVRREIQAAERAADVVRGRARDDPAADRAEVDRRAARALDEIDAVEERVAGLLQGLRGEVMQIAEEAARAEQAGVPVEPEVEVEAPQAVSAEAIPPHVSAGARRRFGRRRGALPHCNVCGRVADSTDAAREHWVQAARMSLCPDCQAEGWQLPDGGTVPYRAAHHRRPG